MENGLLLNAELSEVGLLDELLEGLLKGLPEELPLVLPVLLPQVDMTVGTLTNASTSEAKVELQANDTWS